jgi:transposase
MMGRHQQTPKLYYELSLDQLVPADHLLRNIANVVDFSFVYPLARPHYSHTGQPSVDPVVLFKTLLVGYLYGITSERRLMREVHVNLAYRWFLGYDLEEAIPDHSVLSKARVRFGMDIFESFFTTTIELCREAGLVRGEAAFCDSTLMRANASIESLEPAAGHEPPMTATQYVARVFEENSPDDEEPPSDAGDPPAAGRKHAPTNKRERSRTDPEAQVISHPRFGRHLAYKAHVAVDDHPARVITAAVVTAGGTADEHLLAELVRLHETQTGRRPSDVVADRRYGTMDNYRHLDELGVTAMIPSRLADRKHPGGVWSIKDFSFDAERDVYTCPAGETLTRQFVRPSDGTIQYVAPPNVCASCRFRAQCSPTGKPRGLRRRVERALLEEAERRLSTDEGKQRMRERKVYIETIFAWAKESHGMRRVQWRGRWKVQIQVWLTAAAMNLKKLARATGMSGSGTRLLTEGAALSPL